VRGILLKQYIEQWYMTGHGGFDLRMQILFISMFTLSSEEDQAMDTGNMCRIILQSFYYTMHYSAKRGLAITCRLSVCPCVHL